MNSHIFDRKCRDYDIWIIIRTLLFHHIVLVYLSILTHFSKKCLGILLGHLAESNSEEGGEDLDDNVAKEINTGELALGEEHEGNSGIEVTTGDLATEEDGGCEGDGNGESLTGGEDNGEEKEGTEELNEIGDHGFIIIPKKLLYNN